MLLKEKTVAHRRDDEYPYCKVASIENCWLYLIPDKDQKDEYNCNMSRHSFQCHEHTQNTDSHAANQKIVCRFAKRFVSDNKEEQKQNRETQNGSCNVTSHRQSIFVWYMASKFTAVCVNKINVCVK